MITGGPERHRPDLHLVSPPSRRIRLPHIMFGLSAAALVGVGIYQFREQSQAIDDRPPIAGPAIPGATAEKEEQYMPEDIADVMTRLKQWRESVPRDIEVSVIDYSPQYTQGRVLPKEGIKLRSFPDISSPARMLVKWLDFDQIVDFRYEIVKEKDGNIQESWLMLDRVADQLNQDVIRWQCPDAGPSGQGRCFAASQIQDEELIELVPQASRPQIIVKIPWPRPQ